MTSNRFDVRPHRNLPLDELERLITVLEAQKEDARRMLNEAQGVNGKRPLGRSALNFVMENFNLVHEEWLAAVAELSIRRSS